MDQDFVLRKLAGGALLKRDAEGRHVVGRKIVPDGVMANLFEDGLLRALAEGRYDLSAAGRARARRLKTAERRAPKGHAGGAARQESYRAQHQIRDREEREDAGAGGRVTVNRTESPLGWLRRRRDGRGRAYLDDTQVEAGERLRRDFELAGLAPRVTAAWTGIPTERGRKGQADSDLTERQLDARRRLNGALDVLGPGLSDAALRVCCFLEGLESVEQREGWPVRSAKVVLALALARLAVHYGMKPGTRKSELTK